MIRNLTFLLLMVCTIANAQTPSRIEDLGWLVGTWKRTNNKPGQQGSEQWTIDANVGLLGYGVTISAKDTLFIEKMRIVNGDNNALYFVADVIENPKPVYFKIISIYQNEFICENQQHDFPKRLHYKRKMKQLVVNVSGNGKSIEYTFTKTD